MARGNGSIAVLRRSPALTRIAVAQTVSPLGDAMTTVALILHLQATGGTGTTVAALLFSESIPPLLSPFVGTVVDRTADARRVLAVSFVAQAALVATIAATLSPLPVLLLLVLGRGVFATAANTALGAATPTVVGDEDLPVANAVLGGAREIGSIVGPPLAGLLVAWSGVRAALLVDVGSFLVALPFLWGLRARDVEPSDSGWTADTWAGIRYVLSEPLVRAVAVGFWIAVFATVSDDLVLPFLARDDLHASAFGIGIVMAGASVGLLAGLPLVGRANRHLAAATAMLIGFAIIAFGNTLTAFAPVLAIAFATQFIRGVGIPMLDASVRTSLQRRVPARMLGRAMANVYGGVGVAAALGYLAGGPLLDATSPRVMFLLIGGGGFVAVAVAGVLLRRAQPPIAAADAAE